VRHRALFKAGVATVALTIAVIATLLGIAEWRLRRTHDVPLVELPPAASPELREGERLARIVGCWSGCHGDTGGGGSLDMAGYYHVTAPTLSSVLPDYSDAELVRLIRFGVRRDGASVLGMTSYALYPLSDADLRRIIDHLRAQPAEADLPRKREITFVARLKLGLNRWQLAADQVDDSSPRWGEWPRTTPFERGRYLASITCSECHGVQFSGSTFSDNTYDGGPSLAIVGAYDNESFRKLMRTGVGITPRDLGEMGWVARNGFVHFTDAEIDDILLFLREYHGLSRQD
jgi:cytochrome c553